MGESGEPTRSDIWVMAIIGLLILLLLGLAVYARMGVPPADDARESRVNFRMAIYESPPVRAGQTHLSTLAM